MPLLSSRVSVQSPSIELNQHTIADEYRSRKAPRDIFGYTLRGVENGASLLNLTALEYVIRYYFDSPKSKDWIKNNLFFVLMIVIGTITLPFIVGYFLLKKSKIRLDTHEKYVILLLFFSWFTYTFIFFRKDLNQGLAFSGALALGIITNKIWLIGNYKLGPYPFHKNHD